jgi:branched-chain amino acid transport system permease protein
MGIDNRRIYAVATGIAMITVALAGVLGGAKSSFDPFIGPANLIFAFEAVIIGGLGSLWGTLAGGIVLGVAQAIGLKKIGAGYGELAGHVVFLGVLATRPMGMFGKLEAR